MNKISANIKSGLCFIVYVLIFIGITYTADWSNYENFIVTPEDCPDPLFRFFASFCSCFNLKFSFIFKLYIILMGMAYIYLARKFCVNVFVVIIFAVNVYLLMANQIRFYLAWPLILIAIYDLLERKNISFIFFAVLSFLSHQSVILVFFAFLLCSFISRHCKFASFIFIMLLLSICLAFFSWADFNVAKISMYQNIHREATILGSLYNEIPFWICSLIIIRVHFVMVKNNENILSDISYGYLFNLSFCVILFYGIGFFLHIFVQRFVESMILVWLIYVLYCYNKIELIVIKKKLLLLFAVICIVNPFFALLHYFVKEEDYYMTELVETLSSYSLF